MGSHGENTGFLLQIKSALVAPRRKISATMRALGYTLEDCKEFIKTCLQEFKMWWFRTLEVIL